jgi:predicted O-methyltransferase YrrM
MEELLSPPRRGGLPVQQPCHEWVEVDQYIAERLLGDAPAIDRGDLPPHEVSPPQGALLELLARAVGARAILEIGTLAGHSTAWLARALPPGGRVVTLEAEPRYAAVARRNLAALPVELIEGPALETLPRLDGPFDLVFIDADKRSNAEYLRWALRLSRPGTLIVADNVVRGGAVADPGDDDPSVRGVRAFFDALAAEPRLRATAIQTVGTKGYDGFALALVG